MLIHRRHFLKTAALGTAGLILGNSAFSQEESNTSPVKVGVLGCGGRGMGAAADILEADPGVVIWALADFQEEQMTKGTALLTEQYGEQRVQVPKERCFAGLDGYAGLMKTDVDIVLLCAPPAFRPLHIKSAVEAGKHLFAEKPLAVDVPGVLSVLESAKLAKEKNLIAYDGFCWRFDKGCRTALKDLQDNKFGKVLAYTGVYYNTPPKPPMSDASRPEGLSDLEWSIRNWMALNSLSGGPLVEQAVHTIDLMCWSFGDVMPIAAVGTGGRAQRNDVGDVWDHYHIMFEMPDRLQANVACRQWTNSHPEISNRTTCEKGTLITPYRPRFEGSQRWRFPAEEANNMFRQTHKELVADFRSGTARQMLEAGANKTLVAILGRKAAETGQRVTWEEILEDTTLFCPPDLTRETQLAAPSVPIPGKQS